MKVAGEQEYGVGAGDSIRTVLDDFVDRVDGVASAASLDGGPRTVKLYFEVSDG